MPTVIEPSEKHGLKIAMNSEPDSSRSPISRAKAWEESWPYVGGILAAGAYEFWGRALAVSPNLKDVFSAVVNVAALFAAFFLTSAAILVSLKDSWFKQRAIEAGTYVALVGYMLTAMGWSIATAVVTTLGLLLNFTWHIWWYEHALAAWLFVIVTTLGTSVRVLRIFSVLMQYISREG